MAITRGRRRCDASDAWRPPVRRASQVGSIAVQNLLERILAIMRQRLEAEETLHGGRHFANVPDVRERAARELAHHSGASLGTSWDIVGWRTQRAGPSALSLGQKLQRRDSARRAGSRRIAAIGRSRTRFAGPAPHCRDGLARAVAIPPRTMSIELADLLAFAHGKRHLAVEAARKCTDFLAPLTEKP